MTRNKIGFIAIVLLFSACGRESRDIFPRMSDHFDDVKVNNAFFFIKSFGLSSTPTLINGIDYWLLKNNDDSYFRMKGYLRRLNDSVMVIPSDYNKEIREEKLFDFSNNRGKAWKVTLKTNKYYNSGDSIQLFNIQKSVGDTLFIYKLRSFVFYKKSQREEHYGPTFQLEVSRKHGIVSITKLKEQGIDFDYRVTLYPKQVFINQDNGLVDL
ncbi:hypothetical protein AAFN85_00230 [Mucilaginibacter sp. CAU 1740]|uniref:hypothetical protein n=1 Tax=Mucilaginibacter sp. CAU 1740 TaxID=3140365 RepID=UPI00325BEF5F